MTYQLLWARIFCGVDYARRASDSCENLLTVANKLRGEAIVCMRAMKQGRGRLGLRREFSCQIIYLGIEFERESEY